jgi:hypothetical protein
MRLTWRDAVVTALAMLVAGIALANVAGTPILFVEDARGATLLVGAIGLGMCIVGGSGSTIEAKSPFTIVGGVLGGVAMLLVVAGLFTGSSLALTLLAADTVLLWAVSTVHHAAAPFVRRAA